MQAGDLFQNISDYLHNGKDAIELIKAALSLLPSGTQREEIEKKVTLAAEAMTRSDAALAQKLGYQICRCQFPPSLMLWREKQSVFVCQNTECGRTIKSFDRDLGEAGPNYF